METDGDLCHESGISEIPSINGGSERPDSETVNTLTTKKAVKNVLVLGSAYFLFFTGFWSLANIESTINAKGGLGVDSLAVIYICSMVSCIFPELLIGRFGTKTTYVISLSLSVPYVAANISPRWDTMIISSVLYGLASGPLNAAVSCYLDEMSVRFGASSKESPEIVEAFFFGLSMFFNEFTQVSGSAVVYYALQVNHPPSPQNFSFGTECGVHFDPAEMNDTNTNLDPPSDFDRHVLIGVFILLGVLAVFIALLLDPHGNDVKKVEGCYSVWQRVGSSVMQLRKPHQLLLLPLTIYIGIEASFYSAEFTQAFIACSWGVHHVGFVTICFGVCGALMAIIVGPVVKCISQMSVIVLAAIINVITCALLFVWQPSPDSPVEYFAFAGVWGMTDAIWWSQVAALYGLMFPNDREAAFSNFFFWSFLGYFLSYSYANYFTVAVKINIMLVFLIAGITLYVVGQVKIKCCTSRNTYVAIGDSE